MSAQFWAGLWGTGIVQVVLAQIMAEPWEAWLVLAQEFGWIMYNWTDVGSVYLLDNVKLCWYWLRSWLDPVIVLTQIFAGSWETTVGIGSDLG